MAWNSLPTVKWKIRAYVFIVLMEFDFRFCLYRIFLWKTKRCLCAHAYVRTVFYSSVHYWAYLKDSWSAIAFFLAGSAYIIYMHIDTFILPAINKRFLPLFSLPQLSSYSILAKCFISGGFFFSLFLRQLCTSKNKNKLLYVCMHFATLKLNPFWNHSFFGRSVRPFSFLSISETSY